MKSTISLPVVERLEVNNYALYPGASGERLELTFKAGITVLAGINGVGKTTILNLLLRMLLGPCDPKKLDQGLSRVSDRDLVNLKPFDYFQKRVADPLGPDTTATLDFTLDSKKITVTRLLGSMELKEVYDEAQAHQAKEKEKFSSLQSESRELDIKIEDSEAALAVLENEFHQSDAAYISQALPGLDDKLKFLMQGLTSGLRTHRGVVSRHMWRVDEKSVRLDTVGALNLAHSRQPFF